MSGGSAVLSWSGTPGTLYQAEGAPTPAGPWQAIGAPTINFSVTNVISSPSEVYRVGIFTNSTQYVAYAVRNAGDKAAPSVPSGLSVSASACNQVTISWGASTDQGTKVGGTTYTSGLKGYNLYRGGVFLQQVLAPSTITTDTSVVGSTYYSYTVQAIDNAGNSSAQSSAANLITPPCPACSSTITTTTSPSAGGSVAGARTVSCGTSVTVTATPNANYTFVNWTENGNIVSTSSSYTFSASANRALVANFNSTSTSGGLNGCWTFDSANVSGSMVLDSSGKGNSATLLGSPLPTIVAGKTNQAVSLNGSSGLVNVPDSANLNITGGFTVAAWVNFNSLPAASQYPNIVAKLSSPSSCYGYGISWNGSGVVGIIGSGSPSWTVTPNSPAPAVGTWNHYVVVFDGSLLKLYVNGALYSQTAASAPAGTAGVPVQMGAHYSNPSVYGYVNGKLDDVRIYNQVLTASDITSLYNSAGSSSPVYVTVNASSSPTAGGSTTGSGTVLSGSTITVSASPYTGYTFASWTENGTVVSYSSSYSFAATANRSLVANFTANSCTYTIAGSASPGSAAGSVYGGGIYNCGTTVTLTAVANSGYSFSSWTENGTVVSLSSSYSFTASANRNLVANFATTTPSYTITTSSSPSAGGVTAGGRTVTSGTTVTVTATANAGYTFVNWTENGTVVTSSSTYTFSATANRGLVANFSTVVSSGPWARRLGGVGADSGTAVATDASGNVFVAGYFQGSVDFGGGLLTSSGGYDVFLVKYSSSGAHLWSKRFGSSGNELVNSIALDGAGNIFLGGSFYGTANFGGANLTSAGDADAFIAKFTPQGDPLWSQRFGSTLPDVINSIATDSQGNVVVAGFFQGTVTIGGTTIYSWGGGIDPLLAKFSPDGANLWVKNFYNAGTEYGNSVAVDKRINPLTGTPYDNIVLAGYFNGYINFGLGQVDINLLNTAGGYIAKFNSTGGLIWSKAYGGSNGSTRFWSMALDANGDVAVGGDFPQQTSLGGALINGTSWGTDLFVAKYSGADGSYRWATPILGYQASTGRPTSLSTDAQNNVIMAGNFQGSYTFGSQSLASASGVSDGMVAKFNSSGGVVWAQRFNSASTGAANGVTVDPSSHPVVTGYFTSSAVCAGQALSSIGAADGVVFSLNP